MTSSLAKTPLPLVINRHHLETPSPPKVMTSYVNDPLVNSDNNDFTSEHIRYLVSEPCGNRQNTRSLFLQVSQVHMLALFLFL